MERIQRDISRSWEISPWEWESHHRRLSSALQDYSDQELIEAKQFFTDRSSTIYRLDTWIASHLFTEGLMSNDGFLDLIDCIISTPHYDVVAESADSLADFPEFVGYTEIYFSNIPVDIFDRRNKLPRYTNRICDFIVQPSCPIFPHFDRDVAKNLVPRLYEEFGALVEWKPQTETEHDGGLKGLQP
jgi:hypothetical protein